VDAVAEQAGLKPGMPLADARAFVPKVAVQADEPAATAKLLAQLADWCGRYTPWTAVDGQDGIWLDTAGCAHLFGGEVSMVSDLLSRIAGFGFEVQASLAPTPGAAWALARFADSTVIVEEKELRKMIERLPVAALRLGLETVASFNRLGLRCIGDLYELPRVSLVSRYGEEVGKRLDQALGHVAEPISPRRYVAPFRSKLTFAEPIGHVDDIACGLNHLLADLSQQFRRMARGGRHLELSLFRVDGSVQQIGIGTARATRDPQHLSRLFSERLTTLDPGFGIEAMTLSAPVTEKLVAGQSAFVNASAKATEPMSALMDRLGNRLGFGRLQRLQPAASHLPERAQRFLPISLEGLEVDAKVWGDWDISSHRPIRLLFDPELVISKAPKEKDGTPPAVFQWRHRLYQLRRMDGPERISPEWWRQDRNWNGGPRNYWRIEDAAGRRLWLYREDGEYKGVDSDKAQWFVHGILA
tara:strand:+ start:22723 stop:24135 length:1413 start_codon:yes stop_codon:yes gene_type:complete